MANNQKMEDLFMLKKISLFFIFIFCSFLAFSISEIYALQELDQAKTETEVRIEDASQEKEPPAIGMIKEIEMYGGVQKYLYVALGKKTKGIKIAMKGYIYNDPQMKEKVGKVEIMEIYSDIIKVKILETSYKVDPKGVVYFEIDPRFLIQ
jgi:hypothetical protein